MFTDFVIETILGKHTAYVNIIYAFLLVNGFDKTRDKSAYLARLFLFALISQIPFSLAFSQKNYMGISFDAGSSIFLKSGWQLDIILAAFALLVFFLVLYGKRVPKDFWFTSAALAAAFVYAEISGITLLGAKLNIFYTLAVAFTVIWTLDILKEQRSTRSIFELLLMMAACAALMACILSQSDYGLRGLLLIAALYVTRRYKIAQLAVTAVWAYWMYSYSNIFLLGALAACLPIALYNGKLGKKMRLGFYLVYPLHLFVLFFIGFILS